MQLYGEARLDGDDCLLGLQHESCVCQRRTKFRSSKCPHQGDVFRLVRPSEPFLRSSFVALAAKGGDIQSLISHHAIFMWASLLLPSVACSKQNGRRTVQRVPGVSLRLLQGSCALTSLGWELELAGRGSANGSVRSVYRLLPHRAGWTPDSKHPRIVNTDDLPRFRTVRKPASSHIHEIVAQALQPGTPRCALRLE